MSFSLTILGQRGVNKLNKALAEYAQWTKKSRDVILVQAARSVRFKLDEGFGNKKWVGDAWEEAAQRQSKRSGTVIRKSTLSKFGSVGQEKVFYRGKWGFTSDPDLLNLELQRRTRGKGILSISWRLMSWRYSKVGLKIIPNKTTQVKKGTVKNTSGEFGEISEIKQGADYIRLSGYTPGMGEVDRRYGIVRTATSKTAAEIKWRTQRAIEKKNRYNFPSQIK
jgi:hypothetical protein